MLWSPPDHHLTIILYLRQRLLKVLLSSVFTLIICLFILQTTIFLIFLDFPHFHHFTHRPWYIPKEKIIKVRQHNIVHRIVFCSSHAQIRRKGWLVVYLPHTTILSSIWRFYDLFISYINLFILFHPVYFCRIPEEGKYSEHLISYLDL